MKTTGNTIFISGGSAGIGLAIAKKMQAMGNKIIINGRNEERLQKALIELKDAVGIQGDLSVEADRLRIANELKTDYPDVNVIVNNAGTAFSYLLSETTNAHQKALVEMNTNYIAVIHFTELLLPHLLKKESSAVVNISSLAVYGSHKLVPTYGATKAALHSYTVALRMTYEGQNNLQVYEVYPPMVNTDFSAGIGGENGIPASEVAEELLIAFGQNKFDVPVGETKIYAEATEKAFANIARTRE
ncbi:SDR family NAD(P)-dependent oxidoreductase [Bacteroides graminisolvens]|uniref:SDR family oxidoreductase n=1 Tax=Bacteroides graminisolvens TaxID=477666 RepID=UPI0029C6ED3A|nr:SDR family NAD(P)-dependent oxidoreductase [Bacteroides graminisolvens]